MNLKKYKAVFFDLDGTILESGPSIMKAVAYALQKMGISRSGEEVLRSFIGPSLMDSFRREFHMTEEEGKAAIAYYQEIYPDKGMYEAKLYDGIEQVLEHLHREGKILILVTSKPYIYATKLIEHFGLSRYFSFQTGPGSDDGGSDKLGLLQKALSYGNFEASEVVMIGDTRYDIEAAEKLGIDSVGVKYGYGDTEELRRLGADGLVEKPLELLGEFSAGRNEEETERRER